MARRRRFSAKRPFRMEINENLKLCLLQRPRILSSCWRRKSFQKFATDKQLRTKEIFYRCERFENIFNPISLRPLEYLLISQLRQNLNHLIRTTSCETSLPGSREQNVSAVCVCEDKSRIQKWQKQMKKSFSPFLCTRSCTFHATTSDQRQLKQLLMLQRFDIW